MCNFNCVFDKRIREKNDGLYEGKNIFFFARREPIYF